MEVIRISEADAARDFPGLLERVRDGAEVIIESGTDAVAVLQSSPFPRRSISESITLAEAYSALHGGPALMDESFAADMEAIIRGRSRRDPSLWD
jgi:antitoxin (DNA-binding transcriptional repressor) of toxin-antitoxin stability system